MAKNEKWVSVNFRLPQELVDKLDAVKGDESRSAFIIKIIIHYLHNMMGVDLDKEIICDVAKRKAMEVSKKDENEVAHAVQYAIKNVRFVIKKLQEMQRLIDDMYDAAVYNEDRALAKYNYDKVVSKINLVLFRLDSVLKYFGDGYEGEGNNHNP